jgi:hypothetical protein
LHGKTRRRIAIAVSSDRFTSLHFTSVYVVCREHVQLMRHPRDRMQTSAGGLSDDILAGGGGHTVKTETGIEYNSPVPVQWGANPDITAHV